MYLTRRLNRETVAIEVGVLDEQGTWRTLGQDIHQLLRLPLSEIRPAVDSAVPAADSDPAALPPVSGRMEVWAAGVTYERSRVAREEESRSADVYERVYHADRPELFFKSVPWKVATDGGSVGIRADSPLNVPEPELALLVNAHAEVVGYTICNDMSSRSLEGENPLYLPQAKVYRHACAIAHRVRPAWEVPAPRNLDIWCTIHREDRLVWSAQGSTRHMKRTLDELVSCAFSADRYEEGIILSTGTMLVPDLDITVEHGDVVEIGISGLGSLRNPVTSVG